MTRLIASRLRRRRNTKTITVMEKTLLNGQHSESTVAGMSALIATYEDGDAVEVVSGAGVNVIIPRVFWFESAAGVALYDIREKYVLVDSDNVRYEVLNVTPQAGGDSRLMVECKLLRESQV